MLGDDRRVLVAGREHVARVEREAERRDVGAELLHWRLGRRAGPPRTELRIRYITLMAEWKAEVQTGLPGDIELIVRHVVAHHVTTVIGEPQLARLRVPIEADGVAYALGEHLEARPVGLHPQYRRCHRRRQADVAQRADGYVEQIVGPEGDEFPRVTGHRIREIITDDNRGRWRVEAFFDVVEPQDLALH